MSVYNPLATNEPPLVQPKKPSGVLRNALTLGRTFHACGYVPMIELLRYLEANGFTNYIASGGDRDFMRPVTEEVYGIPSERVIGSSNAIRYLDDEHGGTITYAAEPDVFDDGPVKPIRIWSRIGRRPILAGATRTATSPCSATPAARSGRRCGCSSCTTTPSASSSTRPEPSNRSRRPPSTAGRS